MKKQLSRTIAGWARRTATLLFLVATATAYAGGHFEVDDAGTLSASQCQLELWSGHTRESSINFSHVGSACGVGMVEVGLNWDYAHTRPEANALGPQVKWTFLGRDAHAPLSAALEGGTQYDARSGGRWGGQAMAVLSWQVLEPVQLNADLGSDWATITGERHGRGGAQVQWAVLPMLTLVAERNHAFSQWGSRAGLSWQASPATSIDVSVARIGLNGGETVYTVGLNHLFDFRRR